MKILFKSVLLAGAAILARWKLVAGIAAVLAVLAGMVFNALVDPTLRYLYKIFVMGRPAAEVSFAINFSVTVLNSVVSTILTVLLYLALRAPLKKAGLLFEED